MMRPLERVNLSSVDALEAVGQYLVLTHPDGQLEWHASDRDELILFAYTDIRLLVESCGTAQPWVHLGPAEIGALQSDMGSTLLVAVDVWHPDGIRYPATDPREREPLEYAEHLRPVTDVWIPALPMAPGAKAARVEMYAVTPGKPVLLGYRTLDELHAACGPYQAAITVRGDALRQVAEEAGAPDQLGDTRMAKTIIRAVPILGDTLTVGDEIRKAATGEQSWRVTGIRSVGLVAAGNIGSFVGGGLGTLAGTAAGAAIGAATGGVPMIGTTPGGAIVGAAAGSVIGDAALTALTDRALEEILGEHLADEIDPAYAQPRVDSAPHI